MQNQKKTALSNENGGTGKTTTAANRAAVFSSFGRSHQKTRRNLTPHADVIKLIRVFFRVVI